MPETSKDVAELTPGQWARLGSTWHQMAVQARLTNDGWLVVPWTNGRATYIRPDTCLPVSETRPEAPNRDAGSCDVSTAGVDT